MMKVVTELNDYLNCLEWDLKLELTNWRRRCLERNDDEISKSYDEIDFLKCEIRKVKKDMGLE